MKSVKQQSNNLGRMPIKAQATIESYKLKACEKLLKKEPMAKVETKDESIPALKLFGMSVTGIDPRLINGAKLTMEAPLNRGSRKFIGIEKDARISIKKHTSVSVSLELARNYQGAIVLKDLHISFSRSITIKNPASSLQKKVPHQSKMATAIKNKIADVKIKDIRIDDSGNIFVDGKIKAFHLFNKRLPRNFSKVDLPKLDNSFLESLGLLEHAEKHEGEERLNALSNQLNVKELLTRLGAVTKEISYSLKVTGDNSKVSFLKDNTYVRGPKKPIDIDLKGILDLDQYGDLLLLVDGNRSKISCSLGTYVPHVEASIHHLGEGRPVTMDVLATVKGTGREINVDTFSKQVVQNILPRRRAPQTVQEVLPQSENEFNSSMGAKSIDFRANCNVTMDLKTSIESAKGSFFVKAIAREPYGKTQERGVTMDGRVSAHVNIENFEYEKKGGIKSGDGRLGFGIYPSRKTVEKFPEIKSAKFRYGLLLKGNGNARISPPEYGVTRFIRPVRNLEGHIERIDGSLTNTRLHPIGSKDYFEQVEKITGAKLRDASRVKLLIDGIESMPERLKLINEAQDYICFQTLAFKDDISGWQYAKALVEAARRGVRVYGVVDSLGNIEKLSGLENPNPIYEYLKENGVQLRIYNDFVEIGLRSIFRLVNKYPEEFEIKNPESLMSVAQLLRFLERVIEVGENKYGALSIDERVELKNAIHSIFYGKEGVSPEIAVNELRDALSDNMTTLEELLLLVKRMGKLTYRWHEKYLIADHKTAIVGGMNIADEYLRGGTGERVTIGEKDQPVWRDSDVLLEGDIVSDVYRSFRRNWLHIAQERLEFGPKVLRKTDMESKGSYAVGIIQHRPLEDGDHKVTNFLLYNLRGLKRGEKAWFETAYFLPRGILRALQKEMVLAAKRGVDVRIMTNSETTSDFGPMVKASVFDVRELLEAGARVFYRNKERMVHAKVMVIGDKLTMVGSWNIDNRSATHDSEDVCTIYDRNINQEMTDVLIRDMMEQSDEIALKDMENRKLGDEIISAGMLLAGELV